MPCTVPILIQQTIADFLREDHFWRHLKKMRQCYSERRIWLETALLNEGFDVIPQAGGIQLMMRVKGDDRIMVANARKQGPAVQSLSDWRMTPADEGGILMSFTNITSPVMAERYAFGCAKPYNKNPGSEATRVRCVLRIAIF